MPLRWWSRACVQRIQYGGRPPCGKSKTCNNSATVQPITKKFFENTQIVIANCAEGENLHILKIQDGGRPPYWKSKTFNNSATIQPIPTKFCMKTPTVTPNRAEDENLHILKIQDGGQPPYWKSKTCNNSTTVHSIVTKFCRSWPQTVPKMKICIFYKFKMANGRHIENWKLAITPQLFIRSWRNYARTSR